MVTLGISPKVLAPAALQLIALLVNLIATGTFDRVALAQAVGLALTAVVGYFAPPGKVIAPGAPSDVLDEGNRAPEGI